MNDDLESMSISELEELAFELQRQRDAIKERQRTLWAIHGRKIADERAAKVDVPDGYKLVKVEE